MFDLSTLQTVFVIFLAILTANYVILKLATRKRSIEGFKADEAFRTEGFTNQKDTMTEETNTLILDNDALFDNFYSKVYDQLTDGADRQNAEVNFTCAWIKKYIPDVSDIRVLDIGSGTGGNIEIFRRLGVGKAIGLDKSLAFVNRARSKYPKNDYRQGDVQIVKTFTPDEFNLATMYYFTVYYLDDRIQAFKNIFQWLNAGSGFVVHVVNRDKFDPILEPASPWIGFSVQKYSKERVGSSKIAFKEFDYVANFEQSKTGNRANFEEEFRFKDGRVRKQTHRLRMPTMEEIVGEIESVGFTYKQYIDMTSIGYEYQYLFCFVR